MHKVDLIQITFFQRNTTFFEKILVEPIKDVARELKKDNKYVIQKGFWDQKINKKFTLWQIDWVALLCLNLIQNYLTP